MNNESNEFDIDENTGQVFTVSVAGKAGTFYLEVQATDQGTSRLTARTTVNVRKIIYSPDLLLCPYSEYKKGLVMALNITQ